jgi:predicted ATPase
MLCTSRERLNLSSEAIYVLSGLDYPAQPHLPNEELTRFGAVELLLDRAELIHPRPEAGRLALVQVARICHLVQGMPLALVLASGWLELLSFEEVADEIASSLDILESQARDIPERQRSVRAAFEYSWQRLAVDDQETFSRLAVFRGGFNRQAANQVAGARLRTLRKLVEKSLITAEGPDRYAVHELLRQFAEEKLEAVGQAITTRDAHSSYYLEAIGKREVDLKGRHQLEALEDIEGELDNLRAAWTWALKRQDDNDIDRAQESISLFCYMRSRNQEGWTLFQHALQRLAAKESPTDQRALDDQERLMGRLKARSGLLHSQFAKSAPEIEGAIRESLAVAEVNSDEAEIAYSNLALGHYHSRVTGNFEQALSHFELSLERYQSLAELYYVAHTLHRVGYCHAFVTGSEKYNDYTRQSLELAREIGDLSDAANALGNLGSSSFATGDYAAAEGYFREAISLDRQMGHRWGVAHDTIQLGLCHFLNGRFEKAQDAAAEGVTIAKDIVFPLTEAYGLAVLSLRASIDGDYRRGLSLADESLALFTNEFGISLGHWAQATACLGLNRMEQAWQHSLDALEISHRWRWDGCTTWLLPVVGIILVRLGQSERAAEIMGLYFNHPMRPAGWAEKWPLMNETQAQLKQTLGADGYRVAWERGLSMDMVTAVETLLAEVDTE